VAHLNSLRLRLSLRGARDWNAVGGLGCASVVPVTDSQWTPESWSGVRVSPALRLGLRLRLGLAVALGGNAYLTPGDLKALR